MEWQFYLLHSQKDSNQLFFKLDNGCLQYYFVLLLLRSKHDIHKNPCCSLKPFKGYLHSSSWGWFHQHFTYSFYTPRSQSAKKTDGLTVFLRILGSVGVKPECKMLMKLTPGVLRLLAQKHTLVKINCWQWNPSISRFVDVIG